MVLALVLALSWTASLRADYQAEEQARFQERLDENLWQVVFGRRVVAAARSQVGQPYVWGGASPSQGFDCSGFTAYVFRGLGVPLARTALEQFQQGLDVDRAALLPGDLVFFTGQGAPLHVGIYTGDGAFLHAPGAGKRIRSARLDSPYFAAPFAGARRLTPSLELERRRRVQAKHPSSSPRPRPSPTF